MCTANDLFVNLFFIKIIKSFVLHSYFLSLGILLDKQDPSFIFYINNENTYLEGSVSQDFNLGLSFGVMSKN